MTKRVMHQILLAGLFCGAASMLFTQSALGQTAYVRSDSVNAVVYEGNNFHIYELSLPFHGAAWNLGDLTQLTGAPLAASGPSLSNAGEPSAYVRSDNVSAVVYRGSDNHIHELSLALHGAAWEKGDLTALTGAPAAAWGPVAYRRSDSVNSVVFVGANHHIYEISLPFDGKAWTVADLTALTGAPAAAASPAVYVRSDQVNSVVYRATNNQIYELYLPLGAPAWKLGDLTALTRRPRGCQRTGCVSTFGRRQLRVVCGRQPTRLRDIPSSERLRLERCRPERPDRRACRRLDPLGIRSFRSGQLRPVCWRERPDLRVLPFVAWLRLGDWRPEWTDGCFSGGSRGRCPDADWLSPFR